EGGIAVEEVAGGSSTSALFTVVMETPLKSPAVTRREITQTSRRTRGVSGAPLVKQLVMVEWGPLVIQGISFASAESCTTCLVWRGICRKLDDGRASMGTILLIILILLLLGAVPTWPYSRQWGYAPSGTIGTVLLIVLILVLLRAI